MLKPQTADISTTCFHGGWSTLGEGKTIGPRVRFWPLHALHSVQIRRYLLLPKALEIFLLGGKCIFLRFDRVEGASTLLQELSMNCSHISSKGGVHPSTFSSHSIPAVGRHVLDDGTFFPLSTRLPPAHSSSDWKRHVSRSVHATVMVEDALKVCQKRSVQSWRHLQAV